MSLSRLKHAALFFVLLAATAARGDEFDTIGITTLRKVAPGLQGNGVPVAQAEAAENGVPGEFEVDPTVAGQSASLFTWISRTGTANTYPNGVGSMSFHA